VLNFQTKIYHPNVSNDDKGSMCLGMLRRDEWKPPNKIAAVLNMTRNILIEPNTDDAIETAIADQYKNDRKEFNKVAKEWVKRYAGK
jgi:ubiquitin-protein ligase